MNRPVKTADVWISGLDYSIVATDVMKILLPPLVSINVGEIRHRSPMKMGMILIRFPATGARKLIQARRITVE